MKTHVVLCSYNGEKYIKEQIESILSQDTTIDFFHIFDFSSHDKTVDVINKINIPNLDLHTQLEAKGVARSFFHAFSKLCTIISDDDCIFLVDQDDVWKKNKTNIVLNAYIENIKNHKNLVVAHDVQVVDENLKIISSSFYTGNPYQLPRDLTQERVLLCNPIIGHTMAISGHLLRNICKQISVEPYLMHDWAITLFAQRYGKIIFLSQPPLSLYRQHQNNVLGTMRKLSIFNKIKRTLIFSENLVKQSIHYGKGIEELDQIYLKSTMNLVFLKKIACTEKKIWLIYPYLMQSSLIHGPTIKRKILSLFFLINWIIFLYRKNSK